MLSRVVTQKKFVRRKQIQMLNLQDLKAVWKHDDTSSSKDTWNDSGFFQWPSVWTPQEDNWTPTRKKKPYVRLFNQPCSTFSDRQEATQEPNDEDWFDLIMAQCLLDASNLDEEESFQEETKADQVNLQYKFFSFSPFTYCNYVSLKIVLPLIFSDS